MQLPKKSSQCTEESVSGIKKKVNKSDEGSLAIKGGGGRMAEQFIPPENGYIVILSRRRLTI